MPELPEVETIARKLAAEAQGHAITSVDVLWPRTVDRPDVTTFRAALTGTTIERVWRRAKYLVLDLSRSQSLLVHLRMSGRFSARHAIDNEGPHRHARLIIELDTGDWLDYIDQRKFGRFYLVDDPQEILLGLGPEPLDHTYTAHAFHQSLANRHGEIKRLLLDQHFIAGLGNIYVSEALWHARIHPQRIAGSLSESEAGRLHHAIVDVLSTAIHNGGTSLDDRQYVYPDGGTGEHQQHLNVYDRAGDACPRCGYLLERIVLGQRSTYLCPTCQPRPAGALLSDPTVTKETQPMETTKLKINGMSCQMCVKHVTRALESVDGVTLVAVDLEAGTADVTYDPAKADLAAFTAAVAEADYEVAGTA